MPEQGSGWHARCRRRWRGNPTGAGDAVVAALAAGLASGSTWRQIGCTTR